MKKYPIFESSESYKILEGSIFPKFSNDGQYIVPKINSGFATDQNNITKDMSAICGDMRVAMVKTKKKYA